MSTAYQDLLKIVGSATTPELRTVAIRGFAEKLQWTPSYEFRASFGVEAASEHLAVEHGLEHSAVISFLRAPYRASDLNKAQMRDLLSISYNNLVDWHIFVSESDIRRVNNLMDASDAQGDQLFSVSPDRFDQVLSAGEIERLLGFEGRRRTLRACDDALMQVLSRWKRLLKSDYPAAGNAEISALFNAIIFVRGCEDRNLDTPHRVGRAILGGLSALQGANVDLGVLLSNAMKTTGVDRELSQFVNVEKLAPFRSVDWATAQNLCHDFYAPRDAAYDLNFALMSKHALSRIYERYVSLLRPETNEENVQQLSFIGSPVLEQTPVHTGAVYTPQFIAGFFSRYIRENTTPKSFRSIKTLDPACGSGIFLRTMLELQCNPLVPGTTAQSIRAAFEATDGIDRDPNACEATRLSLALLHLVATGGLPANLMVRNAEAISEAIEGRIPKQEYGAVLVNPPFIKHENITAIDQETYRGFLGSAFKGRLDAYLPFLKLSLDAVADNGFACFVLPQVFLQAENAAVLRRVIAEGFDVRCLVDLSAVEVFEDVGTYNILLIVQRRSRLGVASGDAQIAQVTDFVGAALQACLDGRSVESPYQRVFSVDQSFFKGRDWTIVSPQHLNADMRMRRLPRLSDFLIISQGVVTGLDDIFIISRKQIPKGEENVYLDLLPDRQMQRYRIPASTNQAMFYPYVGDAPIDEADLRRDFPETYAYLTSHRNALEARKPVQVGSTQWWRPERPRDPTQMRRPKIVSPHLMLTPRFSLDAKGEFGVTRSAILRAIDQGEQAALLRFFTAVLNSSACSWFIRTYAPKYGRGYSRVEAALLKSIPVPDFSTIDAATLQRTISSVDKLRSARSPVGLDRDLDLSIADLYGFSTHERLALLGLG